MFERFDNAARAVLARAEQLARTLDASTIGVAHLITAAREHLGLVEIVSSSPRPSARGTLPFEPAALTILSEAFRRAVAEGDAAVRPRHLLAAADASGHPHALPLRRPSPDDDAGSRDAALEATPAPAPESAPEPVPVPVRERVTISRPLGRSIAVTAGPSMVGAAVLALLTAVSVTLAGLEIFSTGGPPESSGEAPEAAPHREPHSDPAPPPEPPETAGEEETESTVLEAASPGAAAAVSSSPVIDLAADTSNDPPETAAAQGTDADTNAVEATSSHETPPDGEDGEAASHEGHCTGPGAQHGRGHDDARGSHHGHMDGEQHCPGSQADGRRGGNARSFRWSALFGW